MSIRVDELRKTIEEMLTAAEVTFKNRGERLSVQRGSSAVFVKPVRWLDEHAIVELVSPVLSGVEKTPALLEKLNELNHGLYFGKAYWYDNGVWLNHNLLGDHLDAQELVSTLGMLALVADSIDDELKSTFGGTRYIER